MASRELPEKYGDHPPSEGEIMSVLRQLKFRASAMSLLSELRRDRMITKEDEERFLEEWDYFHYPKQTARYWRERCEGGAIVKAALETEGEP